MYISRNTSKHKSGNVYHSILLRESYREGKKVKKRTLANLSVFPESLIIAMEITLMNPNASLLLDALKIKLQKALEEIDVPVVTKRKVRKSVNN